MASGSHLRGCGCRKEGKGVGVGVGWGDEHAIAAWKVASSHMGREVVEVEEEESNGEGDMGVGWEKKECHGTHTLPILPFLTSLRGGTRPRGTLDWLIWTPGGGYQRVKRDELAGDGVGLGG